MAGKGRYGHRMAPRPSLIPIDPSTLELVVYVPVAGTYPASEVHEHSAIVSDGRQLIDGKLLCYYQDYGLSGRSEDGQFFRFSDRAFHAAGRLLHNYPHGYPTQAHGHFSPDDLVRVGTIDYKRGEITLDGPEAEQTLAAWIGQNTVAPEELETQKVMQHEQRRALEKMLATGDPTERFKVREYAKIMHVDPSTVRGL